jgi:hypothetical protein
MGNELPDPRMVHKAISLYLGIAYPSGPSKQVTTILGNLSNWVGDFYTNPHFVRQGTDDQFSYCLRLGCVHYPHMKLLVAKWPEGQRYFFQVDAHDKHVVVPPEHPEYAALGELRRKNQILVDAIESAWSEAGLPTFVSCLNDDLTERENINRKQQT